MIPLGLKTALEAGRCVLFVGAGIGHYVHRRSGESAPTAATLAASMANHFGIPGNDHDDLAKVAEVVELRKGRLELEAFIGESLADYIPDENLQWLTSLRWKAIFTTNYDDFIEQAYALNPAPAQTPQSVSRSSEYTSCDYRFEVPVYHLHGSIANRSENTLIVTETDYARFRERRRMLFELLKIEFASSPVLYVGYSNNDSNWKILDTELRAEFFPKPLPQSFRLAPSTDSLDREILAAKGIQTIDASLDEFVANARRVVSGDQGGAFQTQSAASAEVPDDLVPAFESTPAATLRFLRSWTYVNEAPFTDTPNITEFLRGDFPNWALVGQNRSFARDVEDHLLDTLLDYATAIGTPRRCVTLLSPAGFGVSTCLMNVAARLVRERAGPVFMHKRGTPLVAGDIEFALELFPAQNPFFFVDNAADFTDGLRTAVSRAKELGRPVMMVAGERLNEWRQAKGALASNEFAITTLSDAEIERLLECLARENALGVLGSLDHDLRVAAVREKSEKQLLVAMREATEGRGFDAIIEDEYRALSTESARRVYATIACLWRLRVYARDAVVAGVLGSSVADMHRDVSQALTGVVEYECIDENRGEYAARARHHIIAEIVWERCAEAAERSDIVASILDALNLNYYVDRHAFDTIVRSDRTIDSITSFEGRVKFFEAARQKDPDSYYVLQHYARMLLREQKHELALGQIELALELAPRRRVLHHTKGVVLRDMALSARSHEIGRRRLHQSESAFRHALAIDSRDDWSYQSLGELFVGWSRRADTAEESADYLAKAQEVVSEGLALAREREGLWVVWADIEHALGDSPAALTALEKAVAASPAGKIGRYLLGRAHRRAGRLDAAEAQLRPLIEEYPEEHRAVLEYARVLLAKGEGFRRAAAVLQLGMPGGLQDAAFIATLGGVLFLDGDFTEAQKVFHETDSRQFSYRERDRVAYRPADVRADARVVLEGQVATVKAGYAFIEAPGYPPIFCPGSKFGDLVVRKGLRVRFELAFTARGAIALDLHEVLGELPESP